MKCIVHIWKSMDSEGPHFVLRLRPLYLPEQNRLVELFRNERTLSRRLGKLGFNEELRRTSIAHLRSGQHAMWSHVEIADKIFEGFGEAAVRAGQRKPVQSAYPTHHSGMRMFARA